MDKLEPCPFCGSSRISVYGTYSAYGVCLDCEATTGLYRGQQAAADAWNKRAKTTIELEE